MLHLLAEWIRPRLEAAGWWAGADALDSILFRAAVAGLIAFLSAVAMGPRAIRWLRRHWRERIGNDSKRLANLHAFKQGTPTMGGLLILAGLVAATVLCADLSNRFVILGLGVTVGLGTLGAIDDSTKLRGQRRGLSEREKLVGQLAIGLVAGVGLWLLGRGTAYGHKFVLPGLAGAWTIGWWLVPWSVLVIVASSNGLNLTDGLDGLAGGCFVFAAGAVATLAYVGGHPHWSSHLAAPYVPGSGELTVPLLAAGGATLGFLWFNCHPAEVFMGDTGSLALGGLLGFSALVPRQELLLVLAGGVFVAETLSVLLQRYYFRLTRRRVFLCAPLHHHYQFRGWPESKIVVRFWIVGAILAILAVATLKLG